MGFYSFSEYVSKLDLPTMNRNDNKYYDEMQILAYNLVRYLRMNENENERSFQGNHNMTYLEENMTKEDFEFITLQFLRRIPMGRVRKMIVEGFTSHADIIFDKDTTELERQLLEAEEKLKAIKEYLQD